MFEAMLAKPLGARTSTIAKTGMLGPANQLVRWMTLKGDSSYSQSKGSSLYKYDPSGLRSQYTWLTECLPLLDKLMLIEQRKKKTKKTKQRLVQMEDRAIKHGLTQKSPKRKPTGKQRWGTRDKRGEGPTCKKKELLRVDWTWRPFFYISSPQIDEKATIVAVPRSPFLSLIRWSRFKSFQLAPGFGYMVRTQSEASCHLETLLPINPSPQGMQVHHFEPSSLGYMVVSHRSGGDVRAAYRVKE